MHNLQRRVDVSIRSFYIFNSTYGLKEGHEKEKILFYHPKDIELNTKISDIGLSQAFTTFTDTFTDEPGGCEVIHTEKTVQLLYQAEPTFWLVLVLNVPKEMLTKDGVDYAEYHPYELHDDVYRRVLIMAYERFRMQEGTFQMLLDENPDNGREILVDKLEEFFDKYISSLKLPAEDIFEFIRSLQYLPLDKVLFLRVHNFIESLKSSYPTIKDSLFLYKNTVVTCGRFHSTQLYTLYRFVQEHLKTPITANGELTTTRDTKHTVHKIYIHSNKDGIKPYRMVIYPSTNVSLCLFFEQQCNEITQQYLEDIGNVLSTQLYILSRDIEDYLDKQVNMTTTTSKATASSTGDSDYGTKYLFINDRSLQMITNLGEDDSQRKTKLSQNILNVMADIFSLTGDNHDNSKVHDMAIPNQEEIMVKSTDDFWVVKRHGNWRQRFVIVFSTKPTLLDMTKEAERIFTEYDIKDGVFSDK
ncbi:vacuolar fusion protein CCZ1 homolog [Musca vetustissima]|uniref:vacuolar fusion protein CCZ1 homolog n=1 Tax=Musca vetustissima TaxID=27455 RepID=UPI002AB6DEA4|nr:vacuolar fusion protein CCZ1 homolog [Musca vetustissima]